MKLPRILITPGEPAGIGPDVVIQAAQQAFPADLIAITDPDMLSARARALNLSLKIIETDLQQQERPAHERSTLRVHPVRFPKAVEPGVLVRDNALTVIESLQLATHTCLQRHADGIVTGPVQKSIINEAGVAFTGHTEFLANLTGVKQTVMLFVIDQLKAAIVTTHLPLKDVPAAVTAEKITAVATILHHYLKTYFHLPTPRILVAGLNPHAGENGHLGKEELDVITPTLQRLREQGIHMEGPLPADTLFTPDVMQKGDAVLGMYHDQLLPVIKYIGFDRAVNMTLGLPFIRTSVDHGTALALAGKGGANAGSLIAAINLALATQPSSDD